MTLPLTGNPISILNLQLEFDDTPPSSMNEFYGQGEGPASGTVSLDDYYQPAQATRVSSNLLFELDARDSSSWSGSGSTWSDISGNNRDFTLYNGPTGGTNAVTFDGSNDYGKIADATWIPDDTDPFTYEAYASITDMTSTFAGSERYIFSKTNSGQHVSLGFDEQGNGDVHMIAQAENSGSGNVHRDNEYYNMGAASNYEGSYHHYVWTYDGSNLKYYIDGSLKATFTGKTFGDNSAPLRLMCFLESGSYSMNVNGDVRVLRCYSSALSATDVATNYSNCAGGIDPSDSVLTTSPAVHTNTAFTLNMDFDVNVGNFDTNDVSVSGGTKGTFTATSKKAYTLGITPSGTGDVTVAIATDASINAGNKGNNAISYAIPYSTFPTSGLMMHLDAGVSGAVSSSQWDDDSGNGNHATLYNGAAYDSTKGGCVNFDGSNDYAKTGTTNFNSISSAITLSAYIQFDSQPGGEMAFMRPDGGDFFQLGCNGSNKIRNLLSGPAWTGSHDRNITWGTGWRHTLMKYDSSESSNRYQFWIDGSSFYTANPSGSINSNTAGVKIAQWSSSMDGRIMALAVWNRALTSSEITSVYNEYSGRS